MKIDEYLISSSYSLYGGAPPCSGAVGSSSGNIAPSGVCSVPSKIKPHRRKCFLNTIEPTKDSMGQTSMTQYNSVDTCLRILCRAQGIIWTPRCCHTVTNYTIQNQTVQGANPTFPPQPCQPHFSTQSQQQRNIPPQKHILPCPSLGWRISRR